MRKAARMVTAEKILSWASNVYGSSFNRNWQNSTGPMKHAKMRSVAHNIADSLASGIGLLIGVYDIDIFGEARQIPGLQMTIDFLTGKIVEGSASEALTEAVARYRDALPDLCEKSGGSVDEFKELTARFWSDAVDSYFCVTIEDHDGRRSITEYVGISGRRVKVLDRFGRIRRQ
jgi:hypothetical protein